MKKKPRKDRRYPSRYVLDIQKETVLAILDETNPEVATLLRTPLLSLSQKKKSLPTQAWKGREVQTRRMSRAAKTSHRNTKKKANHEQL